MILEIKKCGACGIRTNKGKYWEMAHGYVMNVTLNGLKKIRR